MHCPQGGGKTTMCDILEKLFQDDGMTCVVASIDDFYKTHTELQKLAGKNNLLAGRGPPGTHDIPLLKTTLDNLLTNLPVAVPRYDKSRHGGQGDRRPENEWPVVTKVPDIIVLEGWCLGFRPCGTIEDPELREIDDYLASDLAPIYDRFDAFLTVQVPDPNVVYTWREQAEEQLRRANKEAMTKDQVRAFVDRYMPLYRQYLPDLYTNDVVPGHTLNVAINHRREPIPLDS